MRVVFREELSPQTSLGMTSRYETSGQIPEPQGGFYFPVIQGAAGENPWRSWIQLLFKKKARGMFSISRFFLLDYKKSLRVGNTFIYMEESR